MYLEEYIYIKENGAGIQKRTRRGIWEDLEGKKRKIM